MDLGTAADGGIGSGVGVRPERRVDAAALRGLRRRPASRAEARRSTCPRAEIQPAGRGLTAGLRAASVAGRRAICRVAALLIGVTVAAQEAAPGKKVAAPPQERPAFSAWYRFESADQLGRSTGLTPWPALAHGLAWVPPGEGRWGGAVRLPGTTGAGLYLPNPAAFLGEKATAGTVALWARAAGQAGEKPAVLFDFMVSAGNTLVDGHEVVMLVQGANLVTWPALSRRLSVPNPLAGGQWTHLALAWDATTGAALYVDGRRVAEAQGAFEPVPLAAGWPGRIGCHTVGGGFPWAGTLDELRLFNRALADAEVSELASLEPALPALTGTLSGDMLTVVNTGSNAIPIVLDRWLPGRELAPPWYGFVPVGWNTTAWTAGVSPTEALGEPRRLAPGESVVEPVPFPRDEWGPGCIRVLAGQGHACQELPLAQTERHGLFRRSSPPRFGRLDREGLRVDLRRSLPAVFATGQDLTLPLRLTNDLGRDLDLTAQVLLLGRGERNQLRTPLPVRLRAGQAADAEVRFEAPMGLGRFEVRLTVPVDDGSVTVWRQNIYGTDPEPASAWSAVGAAYVSPPDATELLRRMAADGVTFVRLGGKHDGASLRRNLEAVLAQGMKAWLTPAFSYAAVCADPAKRQAMVAQAQELGTALRDNLAVIDQSMAGEGLGAPPCYCDACTAAFRAWLKARYGSLRGVNRAWGAAYERWEQIEQLGSAADVDLAAERLKMMQVALELPADNTQRWTRLFEVDRPRAMDWRRWHDELLLSWYRDFGAAFRAANHGTVPIGEQPCWANFKTHVFFPLAELSDMGGTDLYLPGEMKTTLGYAAELFLNFDMNASVYQSRGRPVMLHEMYVQDLSPEGLPEAQGWWLAGRGYNLTTFFTYDYYYEGQRAGLPLVFGMFDKGNKPYPCYAAFKRFSADFFAFGARYRPASMRRVEPRAAVFLGDDMSLANILETGGATWEADGVKGHNGSYWLTQRNGHEVEFVNDTTFSHLDRERVLVVPWSPVLAAAAVTGILDFARGGGTVLIDGPFACYDPQYRPYPVCPGAGAAAALGVSMQGFARQESAIVLADGTELKSFGQAQGVALSDRPTVLCRDRAGQPVVVSVELGKGRVVWLLSALGPVHRGRAPEAKALAFWDGLLREARLRPWYRFAAAATPAPTDPAAVPLFDLGARIRDDRELFLYAVSFFGPTRGTLSVDLPGPLFAVKDAVTGQPLPVTWQGNTVSFPLELAAFGARVLRLEPADKAGKPLAAW